MLFAANIAIKKEDVVAAVMTVLFVFTRVASTSSHNMYIKNQETESDSYERYKTTKFDQISNATTDMSDQMEQLD